jgi:pimeloyl-ACP methyl ester carboxylesterase
VLVGSDTGALQALQTAATADPGLPVEGIVLAGTAPTAASPDPLLDTDGDTDPHDDWQSELAARSACPTHRRRLTDDVAFVRGQLHAAVPSHLLGAARPALPALLLHGEADPVTPLEQVRDLADQLPRATLGVLHEGLHDVLNDASHRTSAAAVVQWLERLRTDRSMSPLLTIESDPYP